MTTLLAVVTLPALVSDWIWKKEDERRRIESAFTADLLQRRLDDRLRGIERQLGIRIRDEDVGGL